MCKIVEMFGFSINVWRFFTVADGQNVLDYKIVTNFNDFSLEKNNKHCKYYCALFNFSAMK